MKQIKINTRSKKILADVITPVSIYLKVRDTFPNAILLESSDYHGNEDSYSFICLQPIAGFTVQNKTIVVQYPGEESEASHVVDKSTVPQALENFLKSFQIHNETEHKSINGIFGYSTFDAVQYFEDIELKAPVKSQYAIPEIHYSLYQYIIAFHPFSSELEVIENVPQGQTGNIDKIISVIQNRNLALFNFALQGKEESNLTDAQYIEMVKKGKEHCFRGDVFQIVLSRQFSQKFSGDEFNVYRALRSINPSPYLFYFDYGQYKIFGSSPEAQIIVKDNKAVINPIAGTFKRTGNDEADKILAEKLSHDPKENAEHVMLVDLARNDLSRNSSQVKVDTYREVQYYSHVLHLVSRVSGELAAGTNSIQVVADTFPAGTLSGAPKYKALQLIDKYENQSRGYYGGAIGYIGFNGEVNHAIMIRSFLSKDHTLFYQAGAGVVSESDETSELNEVNNKLMALKKAVELAKTI